MAWTLTLTLTLTLNLTLNPTRIDSQKLILMLIVVVSDNDAGILHPCNGPYSCLYWDPPPSLIITPVELVRPATAPCSINDNFLTGFRTH